MVKMLDIQSVFSALIILQFIVVAAHDWLEIPGLTRSSQVRAVIGTPKLVVATLINSLFPGAAVAFAFWFWNRPPSGFATLYWLTYCAITVLSAIAMWYMPYLFGAEEQTRREYAAMYARTWQVLPRRGENPRPNALHLLFHGLFLTTLALSVGLFLRNW